MEERGEERTMDGFRLEMDYFEWLCLKIPKTAADHRILLHRLFVTPFRWSLEMDANREGDGMALRDEFCMERGIGHQDILHIWIKTHRPCSVLEVMIALVSRCESEFMTRYDDADTLDKWFRPMIDSLGVSECSDDAYDACYVGIAVQRMLDRTYSPDGRGSLFFIPDFPEDMRSLELWEQMMAWIEFYTRNGGNEP